MKEKPGAKKRNQLGQKSRKNPKKSNNLIDLIVYLRSDELLIVSEKKSFCLDGLF